MGVSPAPPARAGRPRGRLAPGRGAASPVDEAPGWAAMDRQGGPAYLREGRVRVEPLVSEAVPLEALPGHFQNRLQGRGLDRIKTLVRL